jgi:hypothetical protein
VIGWRDEPRLEKSDPAARRHAFVSSGGRRLWAARYQRWPCSRPQHRPPFGVGNGEPAISAGHDGPLRSLVPMSFLCCGRFGCRPGVRGTTFMAPASEDFTIAVIGRCSLDHLVSVYGPRRKRQQRASPEDHLSRPVIFDRAG